MRRSAVCSVPWLRCAQEAAAERTADVVLELRRGGRGACMGLQRVAEGWRGCMPVLRGCMCKGHVRVRFTCKGRSDAFQAQGSACPGTLLCAVPNHPVQRPGTPLRPSGTSCPRSGFTQTNVNTLAHWWFPMPTARLVAFLNAQPAHVHACAAQLLHRCCEGAAHCLGAVRGLHARQREGAPVARLGSGARRHTRAVVQAARGCGGVAWQAGQLCGTLLHGPTHAHTRAGAGCLQPLTADSTVRQRARWGSHARGLTWKSCTTAARSSAARFRQNLRSSDLSRGRRTSSSPSPSSSSSSSSSPSPSSPYLSPAPPPSTSSPSCPATASVSPSASAPASTTPSEGGPASTSAPAAPSPLASAGDGDAGAPPPPCAAHGTVGQSEGLGRSAR